MAGLTLFAYYFLIWWLTLFGVLSIGLKTQQEEGNIVEGTVPSAPANPRLGRILVINTIISAIIFAIWYYISQILGFGLNEFAELLPSMPD